MPAPPDALQTKTDAELLFFTENPSFYQPELVAAAQRELRRRGVLLQKPELVPAPLPDYDAGPARRSPWVLVALALVLVAGGCWLWGLPKKSAADPARYARRHSPDSLKLETVETHPLPLFDDDRNVRQQLALLPAAEKTQLQALRQFRGLSRRFWRAQNPSAYLVQQAGHNPSPAILSNHLLVAQAQWNDLYRGLVYGFDLPPTMADHLLRMRIIARIQRRTLKELQADCLNNKPLELTGPTALAQDTVQHLLGPLQHRPEALRVGL